MVTFYLKFADNFNQIGAEISPASGGIARENFKSCHGAATLVLYQRKEIARSI